MLILFFPFALLFFSCHESVSVCCVCRCFPPPVIFDRHLASPIIITYMEKKSTIFRKLLGLSYGIFCFSRRRNSKGFYALGQGCSTPGLWAKTSTWSHCIRAVGLPTGWEILQWGSSGTYYYYLPMLPVSQASYGWVRNRSHPLLPVCPGQDWAPPIYLWGKKGCFSSVISREVFSKAKLTKIFKLMFLYQVYTIIWWLNWVV